VREALPLAAQVREHLGQRDERGAARRGLAHERFRGVEIGREVVGRAELDDRGADGFALADQRNSVGSTPVRRITS
jgi:hypothetical protein